MPHFFVSPKDIQNDRFRILGPDAKHIAAVLRKKAGDVLSFFDGADHSFTGQLETVSAKEITGKILETRPAPVSRARLKLIQGLPKAGKMDWIIEKGTELGFAEFYPVMTQRSESDLKKVQAKADRWSRVARAASEQCGRGDIPVVHEPMSWADLWKKLPEKVLGFIPWESEEKTGLRESVDKKVRDIYLLIGPEGGFTSQEVSQAQSRGFHPITLGPRILRTETAGLVAGSLILYEWGELE